MLRWILASGLVLGSLFVAGPASAQGWGGIGYGSAPSVYLPGGVGYSAGYSAGYAPGISFAGPGFSFNFGAPRYYPQPHWDYHPAHVQRHRNHLHYVPGHYDLHVPGRRFPY